MANRESCQTLRRRLSRLGRYWLLVSLLLLGIGYFKSINLLTLLSWLLLALFGWNYLIAGRALWSLQSRRRIDGPIFAGSPFRVDLESANLGPAIGQPVDVRESGPAEGQRWFLPEVRCFASVSFRREVVLPVRGRVAWKALEVVAGYPFGLVERVAVLGTDVDLVVLPPLGRLHRGRLRRLLSMTGLASSHARPTNRRHATAQSEFHGLRTFRSGDSPRWIHWRMSARCGELMVREFEELSTENLVLLVDPWVASESVHAASPTALEIVISLAATICWEWCRQKGDRFVLIVAGRDPVILDGPTGREHALQMLECLAVHPGNPEPGGAALADALGAGQVPPGPVLVLETVRSDLADRLRDRLRRPVTTLAAADLAMVDFYEVPELTVGNLPCASRLGSVSAPR